MTRNRFLHAFTLVELLVVISIIALLSAFIIPATSNIVKGNALTRGGILVEQTLTKARQHALTKNRKTEVRFFSYVDTLSTFTDSRIQGMQIFEIADNGTISAVSKLQKLPENVEINTSTALSNLVADSSRTKSFNPPSDPKSTLPGGIDDYTATTVIFFPDGSTDLGTSGGGDSGKWYVTLQSSTDELAGSTPPKNFYTVQIDPVSGTFRALRP